MKDIPVSDLMRRDVELVSPATPVRALLQHMLQQRHSCVLMGENRRLAGIVTERDLVRLMARLPDDPTIADQAARRFMSTPVHAVRSDQSLFEALVIARAEKVRHLPVIDDRDRLTGLLTQTDLVEAHFHIIERQQEFIEDAIASRTEELVEANRRLQTLSLEDPLLGIGNRRAMEVDMAHTHSLASRHQRHYTVALFDVDNFKLYNDHYGHAAGDRCLRRIVDCIGEGIRKSDRLYRYGGEELLLLLPDTARFGGNILAQRLIEQLSGLEIPHQGSPFGVVTMSAGVADFSFVEQGNGTSWQQVVERADRSLYQAKSCGRNQVA
ncbi:MAG TPA: GGDEF domain-containing protein [Gammaproteobacteria bacterium]|nr:GGDEF domain-containing protein [Gammaproteobacteria bacterium]